MICHVRRSRDPRSPVVAAHRPVTGPLWSQIRVRLSGIGHNHYWTSQRQRSQARPTVGDALVESTVGGSATPHQRTRGCDRHAGPASSCISALKRPTPARPARSSLPSRGRWATPPALDRNLAGPEGAWPCWTVSEPPQAIPNNSNVKPRQSGPRRAPRGRYAVVPSGVRGAGSTLDPAIGVPSVVFPS